MSVYADSEGFWLGRLSMALACAIARKDASVGREALEEFLRAPVASDELKRMLRQEVKR